MIGFKSLKEDISYSKQTKINEKICKFYQQWESHVKEALAASHWENPVTDKNFHLQIFCR